MKRLLKKIRPYIELYRDPKNGIAWVEDGTSGNGNSCHPNISANGSVVGMKYKRYWGKHDRIVKSHGFAYNIDRVVITGELDQIAADHCLCIGCRERKEKA